MLRGISDPEQIAVSPDGATLYVASEDTGRVMFMDARRGVVRATLVVGGEPEGLAASPDGKLVYATSEEDSTIAVIDAVQPRVLTRIAVGKRPRSIAFLRSARAFVPGENDASLSVIDVATSKVARRVDDRRRNGAADGRGSVACGRRGVRHDRARRKARQLRRGDAGRRPAKRRSASGLGAWR